MRNLTWNQEAGRIEFDVMFYDVYSGDRDEWLSRYDLWIDDVHITNIYYNCSDEVGYNNDNTYAIARFWPENQIVNGRLATFAYGDPSLMGVCAEGTRKSSQSEYNITFGANSWYNYKTVNTPGDNDNKHIYAKVYWYMGEITSNKTIKVEAQNIYIKEYNGSGSLYKGSVSNTVNVTMPSLSYNSMSVDDIGTNGALTFRCRADGATKIDLVTGSSNNTVVQSQSVSNAVFSNVWHIDRVGAFNTSVPVSEDYHFIAYKAVSNGKTTYKYPVSGSIAPPRTGEFSGNLTITPLTCGQLRLNWSTQNPSNSGSNTQGFDLEVNRADAGWTAVSSGLPDYNTGSGTQNYTQNPCCQRLATASQLIRQRCTRWRRSP
jgi:hypothetical protein